MLPIDLRRFSTAFRFPPLLHFVLQNRPHFVFRIIHMRKYFFVYTEINFLICGNFTPCKPAGNAGRVGRVDSRREKPWVDTSSPSFRWGKEGLLGWRKKDLWPSRRTLVQSLSECLELVADLPKLIQRVAA